MQKNQFIHRIHNLESFLALENNIFSGIHRHKFQLWTTTSIVLWFHVINITIILQTHYATCTNQNNIPEITGDVPYYFVLGDPFKHAFEQDAILKSQGPQKYAFLNENNEKVEFQRLVNNGRTNSSHSDTVKDLKVSNSQQSFQNSQEDKDEDTNSQKVFIFDTGNHSDRHGFIKVDRKKKNVLPEESKKLNEQKSFSKIKKSNKSNTKNSNDNSKTKLVADSNWSYGLKNGLKNSNRLIWVATSTSKPSENQISELTSLLTNGNLSINNVTQPKEGKKLVKTAKIIKKVRKPTAQQKPKFVLFTKNNQALNSNVKGNI